MKRTPAVEERQLRETVSALRALVAALGRSARRVEQRSGITNAQLFVLQQLDADGELSINDIAARAMTRQSAVSIIVSRLEHRGLVRRTRSSADGRRMIVSLSAAGRRLARSGPEPPTNRLLSALRELSPLDARVLHGALLRVAAAIGADDPISMPMFEPPGRTP